MVANWPLEKSFEAESDGEEVGVILVGQFILIFVHSYTSV